MGQQMVIMDVNICKTVSNWRLRIKGDEDSFHSVFACPSLFFGLVFADILELDSVFLLDS